MKLTIDLKLIQFNQVLTLLMLFAGGAYACSSAAAVYTTAAAEDGSWICRGERPTKTDDLIHKDQNMFADFGFFIEGNDKIESSYRFLVIPSNYFLSGENGKPPSLRPTKGLRTFVLNSKNQILCMLEGGPMIRSKSSLDPDETADPDLGYSMMSMSFVMKTKNFFLNSKNQSGPHIPVVLLGSLHTPTASEGIGPIFGNQSAWRGNLNDPDPSRRDDPICSAPNPDSLGNGRLGNFSVIESFRDNKVCLFGRETSSTEQYEDDQDYKVEIWARPVNLNGKDANGNAVSGMHNKIRYRVTRLAQSELDRDTLMVDKTIVDNHETFSPHGGWLIFNVIGKVKPFWYNFELRNLRVTYPDYDSENLPQ